MNTDFFLGTPARTNVTVGLLAAIGGLMMYEGIERGKRLGRTNPAERFTLVTESKTDRPSRISGDALAHGTILETREKASVAIFTTQYQSLRPGGHLEVYRLAPGSTEFVFKNKYDEAMPLIRMGGLAVSWHFPAGLFMAAFALLFGRKAGRQWREGRKR